MPGMFQQVLKVLGLQNYYPDKIKLQDVIHYSLKTIGSTSLAVEEVPWRLLGKVLMGNTDARDRYIQQLLESCPGENSSDFLENSLAFDSDIDDIIDQNQFEASETLNPLDIFLATYLCCNSLLKQTILSKFVICRLAVPLIYKTDDKVYQSSPWALGSTVTQSVCQDKSRMEDLLVAQSNKIITFIRCGNSSISKSDIVNNVLSNSGHSTFFHRNCPMGTSERSIYTGTVEASWFFPSSTNADSFGETLMFLNLRGDAFEESLQANILTDIANVVVVILTAECLANENTMKVLQRAHQNKTPVIFGVDASNYTQKEIIGIVSTYKINTKIETPLIKVILTKMKGKEKCLSDTIIDLRRKISEFLNVTTKGKSISECCSLFKQVQTDDSTSHILEAKEKAHHILKILQTRTKKELLPLQGELWTQWSFLHKQYFRVGNGLDIIAKDKLEKDMSSLRHLQCEVLTNLSPFMDSIIKLMTDLSERDKHEQLDMFLRYLQIGLDRFSGKRIPTYSEKYHTKWREWKKAVDDKRNPAIIQELRKSVDDSELELSQACFGIEHVIREIGQMHESLTESPGTTLSVDIRRIVSKLPKVTAVLISKGYPFELLDGDTSCVPTLWVKSVLSELQKIIGDKKLLALSVLGIQSSGKSTLLNTMFGMEFPVKAGRCTRGVFMRLLPVPDQIFPFDFILVIDTEGLRAPELAHMKYNHDNELATFVLGLGDITLVNIKGENTSEVQDVLQIAVHAFLKLKLVNDKIQLRQSCIFVHQNVSALDAKDKLAHATQKTVETLDKMAVEAAEQLNYADINSFQQIIYFESQKHVWYFPDLWLGDPPMAPPNPGYSSHVDELRSAILTEAKKHSSYYSLSETIRRIDDLWKGIMTEDFVFCFRNSLAIKAYNIMEAKFREVSSELENRLFTFMQREIKPRLASCETEQMLNRECDNCILALNDVLSENYNKLRKALINFFDNAPHKDIIEEWREKTLHKFSLIKDECYVNAKRKTEQKKEGNRLRLLNITKLSADEKEINRRAKALAEELKGKRPSEREKEEQFNKMWCSWLERYKPSNDSNETPLWQQIEVALRHHFPMELTIITSEMAKRVEFDYQKLRKLEGSITSKHVTEQHISIHKKFLVMKKGNTKDCIRAALEVTNSLFAILDNTIDDYLRRDEKFDMVYISRPLSFLLENLETFNRNNNIFKLRPNYVVILAIHLCRYLTGVYENMNLKYEAKHGWRAKMEEYKKNVWEIFKNSIEEKTSEYTAATLFKNVIVANTIMHVEEIIMHDIKQFLISQIGSTKHSLITLILDTLADDGKFKPIQEYCRNGKEFSSKWLKTFATDKLFTSSSSMDNKYCEIARTHIRKIYESVIESVNFVNSEIIGPGTDMEVWLLLFHHNVMKGLPLPINEFRNVIEECPFIKGKTEDFSELILKQLETMQNEVLVPFEETDSNIILWNNGNPVEEIFEKIWGCEEHCPFCREPCQFTEKDHETDRPHSCLQHRPAAILGSYWKKTEILQLEVCSSLVSRKDATFYCIASNFECRKHGKCTSNDDVTTHPFHEYKNVIPTWDIPPDNTLRCYDYWAWVISTFQREIDEDSLVASLENVPSTWRTISKQNAKDSLRL